MRLIHLDNIESTNYHLLNLPTDEELVAVVEHPLHGLGSDLTDWESEPDKNLTFSLLLHPQWLDPENTYLLMMAHQLAIYDALSMRAEGFSIKWPNDIYWRNRKIGSILIDSKVSEGVLTDAVIGTGLNINQTVFSTAVPNAVSLMQITGIVHERTDILYEIMNGTRQYANIAQQEIHIFGKSPTVLNNYLAHLYGRQGYHRFADASGEFEARINSVRLDGTLVLKPRGGEQREYTPGQVRFL